MDNKLLSCKTLWFTRVEFHFQRLDFIPSKTAVWMAKVLTLKLNFPLEYSRPGFHMCHAHCALFKSGLSLGKLLEADKNQSSSAQI